MVGAASVAPFQGGHGMVRRDGSRQVVAVKVEYGMVCRGRVGCGGLGRVWNGEVWRGGWGPVGHG